jgi:1-deoxy-D-xylulose-5-phosphate reductoisomerase
LAPAILNAANEIAVQAFLDRQLNFLEIATVIESVVAQCGGGSVGSLEDVLAADSESRQRAQGEIHGARVGRDAIKSETARGAHA